jgi:DNA-binding CsgD family transcriptional regulator
VNAIVQLLFLMRWRPVLRSTAGAPSARKSSWLGRSACGRGSPTRCRTWPCRPAWSSRGPTWRSPTPAAPGRCCAEIEALLRRQPDLGALPAQVDELRASLKTLRAEAPGASTLTEAELRLLPYLATHLSFREIGERLYVSRHTVKSHAMAVYRKLNATSRNAAVERAHELGLL